MKEIRLYKTDSGKEPFEDWLTKIKDKTTKARIRRRVDRLSFGHEGDCKSVGNGVYELRLMFGSGYRIYYGKSGDIVIVLLLGGDKGSQEEDIKKAHAYWRESQENRYEP
jgi:putative addiction module killer protein